MLTLLLSNLLLDLIGNDGKCPVLSEGNLQGGQPTGGYSAWWGTPNAGTGHRAGAHRLVLSRSVPVKATAAAEKRTRRRRPRGWQSRRSGSPAAGRGRKPMAFLIVSPVCFLAERAEEGRAPRSADLFPFFARNGRVITD